MYVDKITITVKSGNGGSGAVSFHTEKYVSNGGPDGGDGGNGGNVIIKADKNINTLIDFYYKRKYFATNGKNGEGDTKNGKRGEDVVIKVPTGTIIRDLETNKVIADMFEHGEEKILLKGGKGGKGNFRFRTPTRRSPSFCQTGVETQPVKIVLELKTIADVGLVGFPNVGKSTLLSVITQAKPKIANYHFTTLSPNLGVVKYYDDSFLVADIPGLIEGASDGVGLGLDFLRHVERTRLLVHVVDISGIEGTDPYDSFLAINAELKNYNEKLAEVPQIVALNKCDVAERETIEEFKKKVGDIPVYEISAATRSGIKELIDAVYTKLSTIPKLQKMEFEPFEYESKDERQFEIKRTAPDVYEVRGAFVDYLSRNVTLDDADSFDYFQRILKDRGVIDALYEKGVKQGDTVIIGDIEFEFWH